VHAKTNYFSDMRLCLYAAKSAKCSRSFNWVSRRDLSYRRQLDQVVIETSSIGVFINGQPMDAVSLALSRGQFYKRPTCPTLYTVQCRSTDVGLLARASYCVANDAWDHSLNVTCHRPRTHLSTTDRHSFLDNFPPLTNDSNPDLPVVYRYTDPLTEVDKIGTVMWYACARCRAGGRSLPTAKYGTGQKPRRNYVVGQVLSSIGWLSMSDQWPSVSTTGSVSHVHCATSVLFK